METKLKIYLFLIKYKFITIFTLFYLSNQYEDNRIIAFYISNCV